MNAVRKKSLSTRIKNRLLRYLFPTAIGAALFKAVHPLKRRFDCPMCGYRGPFRDIPKPSYVVADVHCPRCGSNVRARLQFLAIENLRERRQLADMAMYHFSPETVMGEYFKKIFGEYYTCGIASRPLDKPPDLTDLPFPDNSIDFVFASHILEHIDDDETAIAEISRVLKPDGIAVLPVPITQEVTVEYPEPNPYEDLHVRAPGLDYFDKYRARFSRVEVITSNDFDARFQLLNQEDRSGYPTKTSPLKRPMAGNWHPDYVPICYK